MATKGNRSPNMRDSSSLHPASHPYHKWPSWKRYALIKIRVGSKILMPNYSNMEKE